MERMFSEEDAKTMAAAEIRSRFYVLYASYIVHKEEIKARLLGAPLSPYRVQNWINNIVLGIERNFADTGRPKIGLVREFMGLWARKISTGKDTLDAFGDVLELYSEAITADAVTADNTGAIMAKLEAMEAKTDAELAEIKKETSGIPALKEKALDNMCKSITAIRGVINAIGGLSPEQEKIFKWTIAGETTTTIAKKLKCSVDHVKYLKKRINANLKKHGYPPMCGTEKHNTSRDADIEQIADPNPQDIIGEVDAALEADNMKQKS